MKLTYNKQHVGDVLLVTLKKGDDVSYHHYDGLTVIKDKEKIIGINIFNASKHFDLDDSVDIEVTEDKVKKINSLLISAGENEIAPDIEPKFVVGYVEAIEKHPDADKLNVCQVNVGDQTLQIVCGAPNVSSDQKVVVAKVGAIMPDGLYIKPSKLRGVDSSGMICSKKELGLPQSEKGIYVLADSYEVGQTFNI